MKTIGFFYNPNIHPSTEFIRRVESLKSVSLLKALPIIWHEGGYGLQEWLHALEGIYDFGQRCARCYEMRIDESVQVARKMNIPNFTTTLLYSKYQLHETIREICMEKQEKYGVNFYYEDFRQGWNYGIEESKRLGLYRQPYCGCIFSEAERYSKKLANFSKTLETCTNYSITGKEEGIHGPLS